MSQRRAISGMLVALGATALSGCGGGGVSWTRAETAGSLGVGVASSAATASSSREDEMSMAVGAVARLVRGSGTHGAFLVRGLAGQVERAATPAASVMIPRGISRAGATVWRGLALLARDGALVYEVRQALASDPACRGEAIAVAADDGRVRLAGEVSGPVAAAGAVRVALGVQGVRRVDARLPWKVAQ
jgi:osmotically-inducible protein OsmY